MNTQLIGGIFAVPYTMAALTFYFWLFYNDQNHEYFLIGTVVGGLITMLSMMVFVLYLMSKRG